MAYVYRLVVTFDVPGARPGDRRYGLVDEYLASQGTLTKVFKQVRLLATDTDPRVLAPAIAKIVGVGSSILIVHAAKPYRFVLGNSNPNRLSRPKIGAWMKGAK